MIIGYMYIIYVMGVGEAHYFDDLQSCNAARFQQISSLRVNNTAMPCVSYIKG